MIWSEKWTLLLFKDDPIIFFSVISTTWLFYSIFCVFSSLSISPCLAAWLIHIAVLYEITMSSMKCIARTLRVKQPAWFGAQCCEFRSNCIHRTSFCTWKMLQPNTHVDQSSTSFRLGLIDWANIVSARIFISFHNWEWNFHYQFLIEFNILNEKESTSILECIGWHNEKSKLNPQQNQLLSRN